MLIIGVIFTHATSTSALRVRSLTFSHVSTAVSNELAPAQPLQILPLPPVPFEYQLSNPEIY